MTGLFLATFLAAPADNPATGVTFALGVIIVEDRLGFVVGGVLVAELKSFAQAPATGVVEVDEGGTTSGSPIDIRLSSGNCGGDPKIDPLSDS